MQYIQHIIPRLAGLSEIHEIRLDAYQSLYFSKDRNHSNHLIMHLGINYLITVCFGHYGNIKTSST